MIEGPRLISVTAMPRENVHLRIQLDYEEITTVLSDGKVFANVILDAETALALSRFIHAEVHRMAEARADATMEREGASLQ